MNASRCIATSLSAFALLSGSASMAADMSVNEAETYAVVALFGDDISVVTYEPTVGTHLDKNDQQHIASSDGRFDRLATQVSMNAIRTALPTATVEGMTIDDRSVLGGPEGALPGEGLPALLEAVKGRLKQKDTHYLVLVSKYKGDARLKVSNGTIGSGKLDGIGFYIDSTKRMTKSNTGESGRGFVSPYAYLTVSLIDLRTGAVVRSESATESMTRANVGPTTTLNPWDAMTPEQKIRSLDTVVRKAVQWAVPRVVVPT